MWVCYEEECVAKKKKQKELKTQRGAIIFLSLSFFAFKLHLYTLPKNNTWREMLESYIVFEAYEHLSDQNEQTRWGSVGSKVAFVVVATTTIRMHVRKCSWRAFLCTTGASWRASVWMSLQFSFLQTFSISFVSSSGYSIAAVSVSAPYVQLSARGVFGASLNPL